MALSSGMARNRLTIDDAASIAMALPGVVEGVSYGTRAWRAGRKPLMREKERMAGVLVIGVDSLDERDFLIESDPAAFFITDHYRGYPMVLVRLDAIGRKALAALIERAWRRVATKKLQALYDA
ncbi:MAG: hypothetical protein NW200_04290 [Hyphomonadaceae bacterium]|nr:hypothetical protein [Hyphomonadaceae bacterium]